MKVLISGYYGYDNAGDEAVLEAIVNGLRKRDPQIEITVLSATPAQTAKNSQVKSIGRFSFPEIFRTLAATDVFISGGGTLFQDATSTRSLIYYAGLVLLAKVLRKRAVIFAQGFGPLTGKINRKIALFAFKQADRITVRDNVSYETLLLDGVEKKKLFLTADPALLLPIFPGGREFILKDGIGQEKPLFGISVRGFVQSREKEDAFYSDLAAAIDRFVVGHGFLPLFVPFQFPDDRETIARIRSKLKSDSKVLNRKIYPQEMLSIFAEFSFFVGMRLHALIFAAMNGVPSVGIAYDPKISAFARAMGIPQVGTREKIEAVFLEAFANREQIKTSIGQNLPKYKLRAENNFDLFFEKQ